MEISLKKPVLFRYSNPDHLSFHKVVLAVCKKHVALTGNEDLVLDYERKVELEERIYKWMRKSEFTAAKVAADRARDETGLGMMQVVRGYLHHFEPDVRDAARHVNLLLKNCGDFRHATYDAETVAVDSIVAHLQSQSFLEAVGLLGLAPWVDKLAADNALFKARAQEAIEERMERPEVTTAAARRETDVSLRRITARVGALMTLDGPEIFAAFAEEYNGEVKHYNTLVHEHYGRLHARIDIAPALVGDIPPQAATGYPVYVIPVLTLRRPGRNGAEETVRLEFSTDFTVTYKNNVHPGTATLTAQGAGKYKGKLITTFTIF